MVAKNWIEILVTEVVEKLDDFAEWKANRDVFHWVMKHNSGFELVQLSDYWSVKGGPKLGFFQQLRITRAVNQCLAQQQIALLFGGSSDREAVTQKA